MIMQEQWWDVNIELLNLQPAPICDAYLINGLAGDSYPCSKNSNTHSLRKSKDKRTACRKIDGFLFYRRR